MGLACDRPYREAGGTGSVTMMSADRWAPYNRPPLTKEYLRGEVEADSLALTDDEWYDENAVTLLLDTMVSRLDPRARTVQIADGTTVTYRALVLATGSTPTAHPSRVRTSRACTTSGTATAGSASIACAGHRTGSP